MNNMELIKADSILAYSLEVSDLIMHDGDIVEVIDIVTDSTGDNYTITVVNDFGEEDDVVYTFDSYVDIYVTVE